jgi:CheY-like chemotaxis protein
MSRAAAQRSAPPRILLVDDNKMGLAARKTVLKELGYEIAAIPNPLDALEWLARERCDLVVTDFKMPAMNGIELIQEVRKIAPGLPAVLISGFVDALGLDETTTGADAVVQKSANEIAHLVRAVKRLLEPKKKPAASHAAKSRVRHSG